MNDLGLDHVDYLVRKMNIKEHSKPIVSSAFDPRYDERHH